MGFLYTIMLLAAYSDLVSAGPLPRDNKRQLFQSYANTTQTLVSQTVTISHAAASPSKGQLVNADTAIVIEPVQRTIITHVIPAVTFLNPKGEAIATQTAETVLSTSYFTPTPQPAPSPSIPTTSSVPSSSSPSIPSVSSSSSKTASGLSSPAFVAPMSSQAAVESGPLNQTSRPAFTFSPEESQPATPIISATPIATEIPAAGNSTGLPGFNHPGSGPSGAVSPKLSSSSATTNATRSPSLNTQSTPAPILTASASIPPAVVTKTEYTTVFPAPTISTPVDGSELAAGSTIVQPSQSLLSSSKVSPALLSPTPLEPPPVVIITQYTTVAPAPTGGAPKPVSSAPSSPSPVPRPSSPVAEPPKPAPSSATPPTPPSPLPEVPTQSSSPRASSGPAQVSSSPTPSLQPPPGPSISSPAASSTTTEGPLIITPIAPSQIFTVTVTATEKETITETATVSVTVTA